MKKGIVIVIIIAGILLVGFISSYTNYENVTFIEHGERGRVSYRGREYQASSVFSSSVRTIDHSAANENDIQLGWYYSFPFTTYFYADTAENPTYIYSTGSSYRVYVNQDDYHNKSEVFVIDKTTDAMVLSDAITGAALPYDSSMQSADTKTIHVHCETYPHFKGTLQLFCYEQAWYVLLPSDEVYLISPQFLKMLSKRYDMRMNGISP